MMITLNDFPLENKRGITVAEGGKSFEINFRARNAWFTDEEEEVLKEAGYISQMGMYNQEVSILSNEDGSRTVLRPYIEKPYQYSKACAGYNNLFPSLRAFVEDAYEEHVEEALEYYTEKLRVLGIEI